MNSVISFYQRLTAFFKSRCSRSQHSALASSHLTCNQPQHSHIMKKKVKTKSQYFYTFLSIEALFLHMIFKYLLFLLMNLEFHFLWISEIIAYLKTSFGNFIQSSTPYFCVCSKEMTLMFFFGSYLWQGFAFIALTSLILTMWTRLDSNSYLYLPLYLDCYFIEHVAPFPVKT